MTDRFLKVLAEDGDSITVGGYGVVFGGEDLYKETFTKDTDFFLDAVGAEPMLLYDHGMNSIMGNTVLAKRTKLSTDDVGIFVQAELNRSAEYWEFLEPIVEAGKLGMSSGAVSHLVEYADDNKTIRTWPIAEFSLTATPAEPRTVGVSFIRSFDPRLAGLKEADPAEASGNDAPESEIEPQPNTQPAQVRKVMSEEVKNIDIRDQLNAITADLERRDKSEAEIAEWRKSMTKTLEAMKNAPVFNPKVQAAPTAEPEDADSRWLRVAKSFKAMRSGDLAAVKASGMNEAVAADGGFLVGETVGPEMLDSIFKLSGILPRCTPLPVTIGNTYVSKRWDEIQLGNGQMLGGIQIYNVGEGISITASQAKLEEFRLQLGKKAALVYCTEEEMEDAPQLMARIRQFVPLGIQYMAESEFFTGTGVGDQFLGILNAPATISTAAEDGQAADTIVVENILNMVSNFLPSSAGRGIWLASPKTLPQLAQLAIVGGTSSTPVFMNGNIAAGLPASILGMPLVYTDQAEALGDNGDIYLVDPMYYGIASKGGVRVADSTHVKFVEDEVAVRFTQRMNGKPLIKSPITSQNGTDTYSPFVTLAERA